MSSYLLEDRQKREEKYKHRYEWNKTHTTAGKGAVLHCTILWCPWSDPSVKVLLSPVENHTLATSITENVEPSTQTTNSSIQYHANVLPLPCVEHSAVFHRHVQLPPLCLLQGHVKLKSGIEQNKKIIIFFYKMRSTIRTLSYLSLKTGLIVLLFTCVLLRCLQLWSGSKYRRT